MKMGPKKHPKQSYWDQVRNEAARLGSDGCTGGTGAFADCCLEHDVHWRTGHQIDGTPITPRDANRRFLACMRSRSRLGYYSPMALWRYFIVTVIKQPKVTRGRNVTY